MFFSYVDSSFFFIYVILCVTVKDKELEEGKQIL